MKFPIFPRSPVASACVLAMLLGTSAALAADWPPTLDQGSSVTRTPDGLTIERFTHGPRQEWGYPPGNDKEWTAPAAPESGVPGQNHCCFYLIAPKNAHPGMPLCVVLHSANRTAYDQLALQHFSHGDTTVSTRVPDDFYGLYLSSSNSEWWGAKLRRANPKIASPAEKRALDTIEWVVTQYGIDRNRIYLTGLSMGGCGTLALGMPHGEVFAAIRAQVPAGTEYVAAIMGGFPPAPAPDAAQAERDIWTKTISAVGFPDPPILVDFSSPKDNWSKTQPPLVQAAFSGRLPLVLAWGPFGHTTFTSPIAKYPLCESALEFPWTEIRRNEAYPVFTNATSDQHSPWRGDPANFDETGQINACFRWKSVSDTPSSFTMQLWLAHPKGGNGPPALPETSTADITLRRLQLFKVRPGVSYTWQFARRGKSVASGKIIPDAANLLTIPKLTVTTDPAELSVKTEE